MNHHSSDILKQKLCSNRRNAPISQEIVLEIVGLASALVHLFWTMKYPRGCSGNGSTNGSSSIISVNPRCSMHFLTINSRWYSWVSAVPEIPQVRPGPVFDTYKVKILDTSCCACTLDNQAPTQNKIQDQLHRHLARL